MKVKRSVKISEFIFHSKKSSSTSPWITEFRISKQENSPCFNGWTQEDVRRWAKEKSNMDKGEMGNYRIFWWEKV